MLDIKIKNVKRMFSGERAGETKGISELEWYLLESSKPRWFKTMGVGRFLINICRTE